MGVTRKSSWHGPKQIGTMFYCTFLMLIGSCIVGGSTNTILPVISETYGWDVNFLRMMAGVGVIAVALGFLVFGTMVAKRGPKFTIALTLILTAIFTAIYGLTSNLVLFVATILILGFLSGGYQLTGANAMVNNWWPTKKGIVLGWVTMGIVAVDVLWQPFMPRAFAAFGVSASMCGVAAVVLIVAIIGMIATKNLPEEAGEFADGDADNPEKLQEIVTAMRNYQSPFTPKRMLRTRATWDIGIGMGLLYLNGMCFVASIVPRLLSCGYEYSWATTVLLVGGIFGLAGSWAFGWIDQRIGTKRASLAYATVCVIAFIIALFHQQSQIAVWVSAIFFFASQGGCCNLIPSFVGTKFGRWDYPAAYRVIGFITQIFSGVGVLCTGLFGGDYTLMYIVNICLCVVAFIILFRTDDAFIGKAG